MNMYRLFFLVIIYQAIWWDNYFGAIPIVLGKKYPQEVWRWGGVCHFTSVGLVSVSFTDPHLDTQGQQDT